MKDEEHNSISVADMIKKLAEERDKILNDFCKAYLAETQALPSEIELVTLETSKDGTIEHVYFFRRRSVEEKTGEEVQSE